MINSKIIDSFFKRNACDEDEKNTYILVKLKKEFIYKKYNLAPLNIFSKFLSLYMA